MRLLPGCNKRLSYGTAAVPTNTHKNDGRTADEGYALGEAGVATGVERRLHGLANGGLPNSRAGHVIARAYEAEAYDRGAVDLSTGRRYRNELWGRRKLPSHMGLDELHPVHRKCVTRSSYTTTCTLLLVGLARANQIGAAPHAFSARRPGSSALENARTGEMKSGQLPNGGWPGARAGWLAARVHPVSLRFMHDACMI